MASNCSHQQGALLLRAVKHLVIKEELKRYFEQLSSDIFPSSWWKTWN